MRLFQHLLAAVSLTLIAASASATPANPQNGVDYRTLATPQQTDSTGKVEVIEFFWYACPHCYAFDPALSDWVKKQGDRIAFKRVPVNFRESFIPQQKMFYALEAMGKLDELHKKIFNAIHVERKSLDTDAAVTDFVTSQGVDKQKFLELYNSFGVQSKVRRATQLQSAYEVDGVPLIAINGRYLTSPSIVGASMGRQPEPVLQSATLQVMDALVARAAAERSGAKPAK
ncbi:thiol:disulfide interchange protein DsbA/DsbL [Noviherbaspirillum massiliense]|uniref:thiol:disulfide interchange protein DsbA/DsbL n=1 Tax=Noviherbaspirillum massiliense TaxID=1465823 RepID=UPI00037AEDD1|nr:thiol:disulfide interchange protein DsbA/DsbL [Noviherbaspirillum massiliense]